MLKRLASAGLFYVLTFLFNNLVWLYTENKKYFIHSSFPYRLVVFIISFQFFDVIHRIFTRFTTIITL